MLLGPEHCPATDVETPPSCCSLGEKEHTRALIVQWGKMGSCPVSMSERITPLLWCSALSLQPWGGCRCRNLHLQHLSKLNSASLLRTDFNKWLKSLPKWIWTSCTCQRLRRMKVAPGHVARLIQLYSLVSTGQKKAQKLAEMLKCKSRVDNLTSQI